MMTQIDENEMMAKMSDTYSSVLKSDTGKYISSIFTGGDILFILSVLYSLLNDKYPELTEQVLKIGVDLVKLETRKNAEINPLGIYKKT